MNIFPTGIFKTLDVSEIGPADGLFAWYPLQGDTDDYAGNNDGVNNGAVPAVRGYEFDGSSNRIDTYAPQFNEGDSLTICGWYKTTGTGRIYEARDSSKTGNPLITLIANGSRFTLLTRGQNGFRRDTNTPNLNLNDGVWHHFATVITGPRGDIYIDGQLLGSNTSTVDMRIDLSDIPIPIGCRRLESSFSAHFPGFIDDFRVYHRDLSAEEITILYEITNPEINIQVKQTSDCVYVRGHLEET